LFEVKLSKIKNITSPQNIRIAVNPYKKGVQHLSCAKSQGGETRFLKGRKDRLNCWTLPIAIIISKLFIFCQ